MRKTSWGGGKTDPSPSEDNASDGVKIADLIGNGSEDAEDQDDATESEAIQVDVDTIEKLETEIEESSVTFTAGCKFECVIAKKVGESTEDTAPMSISVREAEDIVTTGNDITENDTMKKVEIGENQIFEMDKYLSEPTGEKNHQNTYELFLEQAAIDDSEEVEEIKILAPKGQDIIFVIDLSSSMRLGSRLENMNEGLKAFFNRVKEINNSRLDMAKAGEFTDIHPDKAQEEMQSHFIRCTGIVTYSYAGVVQYNNSEGCAVLKDEEIETLMSKAGIKLENTDYGTRTGFGLEEAYKLLQQSSRKESTYICLLTDGGVNGGQAQYDLSTETAKKIKSEGGTIFCSYYGVSEDASAEYFLQNHIFPTEDTEVSQVCGYLSMLSSDYQDTGKLQAYQNGSWDLKCVQPSGKGIYGKYTSFCDVTALVGILIRYANQMNVEASEGKDGGYASAGSVVQDVITMPFEVTDGEVVVYEVPRIPLDLDEDGVPQEWKELKEAADKKKEGLEDAGISGSPADESPEVFRLTKFRWGERVITEESEETTQSEWIDVTNLVSAYVSGNTVTVTGYDYEQNALTDYDKDTAKAANRPEGAEKYEPGDYGYKLVVVISLNAKLTFGGNGIETNDPDKSIFIPSDPTGEDNELPKWKENKELNPDGVPFIEKYPVPKVDLKVNYKIVSDNMIVYAPQTAKLRNLVTDAQNCLWYTDAGYADAQTALDNALQEYEDAAKELSEYESTMTNESDSEQRKRAAELEGIKFAALDKYAEAVKTLEGLSNYTPDGLNNQFVNIRYELKDPDGTVLATMEIPHGRAFTGSNIDWTFNNGNDIIKKSGKYTIEATVTPVDTEKADGGYIWTDLNSDAEKKTITNGGDQNSTWSEKKSSTGSKGEGSQEALTITENPTAYLYQLKIKTDDSRLTKNQALDFNVGTEPLLETENPHIAGFEWVCTDGTTPSVKENEPGVTRLTSVGGGVSIVCQIPDQAITEELAKQISETWSATAEEGKYVPVSVILSRMVGVLDKGEGTAASQASKYMTDSDNIWGEGLSSVVWEHECGVITEYDCERQDFYEAQEKYSTNQDASENGKGKVRFLIHVLDNPMPDVTKETSTPRITLGMDVYWKLGASNNNEESNPKHRSSAFSLVDIMPFEGDGRIDPNTNNVGSDFGGTLMYKSVTADCSNAPASLAKFKSGDEALFYTDEEGVRTAPEMDILGNGTSNIPWKKAEATITDNQISFTVPEEAVAIKLDASLKWEESISVEITANLKDLSEQETYDRYHNSAFVLNGNGKKDSNVVATTVEPISISGTIWEDSDANGLINNEELKLPGILVTLYMPYDERNGGTPDRVIGDIKLSRAYNADGDKMPPLTTEADGGYVFEEIQSGTYYVVTDQIPEYYSMTKKQAGKDDQGTAQKDSEAEEKFAETSKDKGGSAWIKSITVSGESVWYQNFGLKLVKGTVQVYKTLDEIYYPSTMTDEEKADYRVSFLFQLANKDTGAIYSNVVYLDESTLSGDGGKPVVSCSFTDLPLGTYALTEMSEASYNIENVAGSEDSVAYYPETGETEIKVTAEKNEIQVYVENKLDRDPPGGDENGVANHVNMRIPVRLEIIYKGPDPIRDQTVTKYKFKQDDFEDIIVTYDDGSQISLKAGTLRFDQITLSPDTVTNDMNTSGNGKIAVSGYYSEKGRTVMDSFRVGADLKPIHKFYLNFNANGSRFDNGQTVNGVRFAYDENISSNYVVGGSYKDVPNKGLDNLDGFTFAGWNTQPDGQGTQYDNLSALNAVGRDTGITSLTLYANWKTKVTFNANGGKIANGTTAEERALTGKDQGTITVSRNQKIGTTMTANKGNYAFVLWNTEPDGTGTALEGYGGITGPVTFYAVLYQSEYSYIGSPQTFIAPVNGWYKVQLWGAKGGDDDTDHKKGNGNDGFGGNGAYVTGEIYLKTGTKLYVYVGQPGMDNTTGRGAGWNGGGNPGHSGWSGSGGGATDIRTVYGKWNENLSTRIAVAAGGGGAGVRCNDGGYGGALIGGNGKGSRTSDKRGIGGTQSTGGKKAGFGYGGTAAPDGGGGGSGWFGGGAGDNDTGAGGGSSYLSGFNGCSVSATGYTFKNGQMIAGNQQMPRYEGGTMVGNSGPCFASIRLMQKD